MWFLLVTLSPYLHPFSSPSIFFLHVPPLLPLPTFLCPLLWFLSPLFHFSSTSLESFSFASLKKEFSFVSYSPLSYLPSSIRFDSVLNSSLLSSTTFMWSSKCNSFLPNFLMIQSGPSH